MRIENYIEQRNNQLSEATNQVDMMKDTFELVQTLGGFTYTTTQSDKLGYDWRNTILNDVVVAREYVEQPDALGTSADNPIIYTEGTPLINNAFYSVDGVIKVWMEEWVDWDV